MRASRRCNESAGRSQSGVDEQGIHSAAQPRQLSRKHTNRRCRADVLALASIVREGPRSRGRDRRVDVVVQVRLVLDLAPALEERAAHVRETAMDRQTQLVALRPWCPMRLAVNMLHSSVNDPWR
jgi:hypothetical protein